MMRPRPPFFFFAAATAAGAALLVARCGRPVPAWALGAGTAAAALLAGHELLGRPVPLLRWSVLRMLLGARGLLRDWQVGDGREEAAVRYVLAHARPGAIDDAIRAIDEYAYRHKFLINVGDEKAVILEQAVRRVAPRRVLELGAYIGYSALRIARSLPAGGHLYSVELNPANAELARRVVAHAGAADRVTFLVGSLDDQGATLARLEREHGFQPGGLDLVFVDHAKDQYLPDLQRILAAGWLREGSVVLADNMGFPGSPPYRRYMKDEEGKGWRTRRHRAHVEYQSVIPDLVYESTLLRAPGARDDAPAGRSRM
jgi:catechol O-methyltransferase